MVERSLSMREVPGSMPGFSNFSTDCLSWYVDIFPQKKDCVSFFKLCMYFSLRLWFRVTDMKTLYNFFLNSLSVVKRIERYIMFYIHSFINASKQVEIYQPLTKSKLNLTS